ncbi:hypothetical protein DRP04_10380 [Archaeoglobales archaeon]|nr:MAG: hypothetical protein DRP04_10380 [Archaeoglobales archaeon]
MAAPTPRVRGGGYGGIPSVGEVALEKKTARVYVPRIIHVDWDTIHVMIGVAAHTAWKILAKKYKMIRLRGKRDEFHRLTGEIMRKWCWELVEGQL